MKKALLYSCLIILFLSCKKDTEEKKCYVCTTYNEMTFKDGHIKKDTIEMHPCGDAVFINKYITDGNYNGESWSKESGKDTVFFYLKAKTECKLK